MRPGDGEATPISTEEMTTTGRLEGAFMTEQPVLKKGADGSAVRRLQKALAGAGHVCAADGDFGPGTERAVKAFQVAQGLTPDGVVGAATWAALGVSARSSAGGGGGKYRLSMKGAAFIGHF